MNASVTGFTKAVGGGTLRSGRGFFGFIFKIFSTKTRMAIFLLLLIIFLTNAAIESYEQKSWVPLVSTTAEHFFKVDNAVIKQVDELSAKKEALTTVGESMKWYHYTFPGMIILANLIVYYYYFLIYKFIRGMMISDATSYGAMDVVFFLGSLMLILLLGTLIQYGVADEKFDITQRETWSEFVPFRSIAYIFKNYDVFVPGLQSANLMMDRMNTEASLTEGFFDNTTTDRERAALVLT